MQYEFVNNSSNIKLIEDDGTVRFIPNDIGNRHWREYQQWFESLGLIISSQGLILNVIGNNVNESLEVEADPSNTKYIKVGLASVDNILDIVFFEKTTGEYGANPPGYIKDLAEYSVVAAGSELVEV